MAMEDDIAVVDDHAPGQSIKVPDDPARHAWRQYVGSTGSHELAEDASYVFGLGAQKAGSTWLFEYLKKHPQCHGAQRKEVHYFSQPYHPDLKGFEVRFLNRIARRGKLFLGANEPDKAILGAKMLDDALWRSMFPVGADGYAGYFRYLSRGYKGQECICDITPAYAIVERDMLAEMHRLVPRSRFVFFMRDPVDRLWSQSRMRGFKKKQQALEKALAVSAKFFKDELKSFDVNIPSRNNYLLTLKFLEEAVPTENVFTAFFETFFEQQNISGLSDFLGIERVEGGFDKRVNASLGQSDLPPELAKAGARVLAPVYEDAFERFGDAVPESWHKSYEAGK